MTAYALARWSERGQGSRTTSRARAHHGKLAPASPRVVSNAIPLPTEDLKQPRQRGSAPFVDADQVARGIAEGAVANPVRLLGRLLDDLGVSGLQPREGAVEVGGGQDDVGVAALRHHLDDGAALIVGDAAPGERRRLQDDRRAGLVGGADRDPAHPAISAVVAD